MREVEKSKSHAKKAIWLSTLTVLGIGLVLLGHYLKDGAALSDQAATNRIQNIYDTAIEKSADYSSITEGDSGLALAPMRVLPYDFAIDGIFAAENYLLFEFSNPSTVETAGNEDQFNSFVQDLSKIMEDNGLEFVETSFSEVGRQFADESTTCYHSWAPREQATVACALHSNLQSYVDHVQPFYAALQKNVDYDPEAIVQVNKDRIAEDINGYDRAIGSLYDASGMGGGNALFYRATGSADWTFFTSAHAILDCEEFAPEGAQKAFADKPCFDINTPDDLRTVADFYELNP